MRSSSSGSRATKAAALGACAAAVAGLAVAVRQSRWKLPFGAGYPVGRVRQWAGSVWGRLRDRTPTRGDPSQMTRDELYQRAKELDIEGRSKMTKDELVKAIGKQV